jgi:hypothetical protein
VAERDPRLLPHDWTDWFDLDVELDHPLDDMPEAERAKVKKDAEEFIPVIEAARAQSHPAKG